MEKAFLVSLLAGLALASLLPPLPAQTVGGVEDLKWRFDGVGNQDQLGFSVAIAGDVDADGIDDVIVGAPNGTPSLAGKAYVFSGATGAQLWRFDGLATNDQLGWSVAGAGDVNGDGFSDLIVGAPGAAPNGVLGAGSAYVFSGATGAQLFRFDGPSGGAALGFSVAGAGDVDGDGSPDQIVGAVGASPNNLATAGSAYVFSGVTGTQLWRFDGQAAYDDLGNTVAGAGDVNGDGFADLIVGAFTADPNGLNDAGAAYVFSGATGAQIWRFAGQAASEYQGYSAAGAGDVNGDGTPDLIVGALGTDPNGLTDAGSAFVYSGATGAQLWRFDGLGSGDQFGRFVAGPGDVDGDGFPDLMVGAPYADPGSLWNAGSAYVFSGAAGTLQWSFNGPAASDLLGYSGAGGGDVDGDGLPDLMAGDIGADPNGLQSAGSAFVFTFNPILTASSETFSVSAGGTIDYPIDFPDVDAGQKYGILLSLHGTGPTLFKGLLVPLTKDSFFVDSIHGHTPPQGVGFQGVLDAQGKSLAHFTAGPGSLPGKVVGNTLFLAAVNKNFDFSSVFRRIDFTP